MDIHDQRRAGFCKRRELSQRASAQFRLGVDHEAEASNQVEASE
jgi:hypothetical protein